MATINFEKYVINCSNCGDSIKGISEHTASTISDCYSSDDDYKEGILQDYLCNQSSLLLSHESTAFDDNQSERKSDLIHGKQHSQNDPFYLIQDALNGQNQSNNQKLSLSVSDILNLNQSMEVNSPEMPLGKCISEFYRPPSRSKNSLAGRRADIGENASISSNHYIEPCMITSSIYPNSKMFPADNLSTMKDIGNFNDLSASLFNCSNQARPCNRTSNEDSTRRLISSTSLNSRSQSESANQAFNIQHSNSSVFLDYEYTPRGGSKIENFTHSVSYRKPKVKSIIKSTTTQSTNELDERTTQTIFNYKYQEKCIGTIEVIQ